MVGPRRVQGKRTSSRNVSNMSFKTRSVVQRYNDNLIKSQKNLEKAKYFSKKLEEVLPEFNKAINKKGFEIVSLYPRKTGSDDDWKDSDYLYVDVALKPTSSNFKLYSSTIIAQKNAKKLEDYIKENTKIKYVSVNQFSLKQDDHVDYRKEVLLDFWIKE